MARNFRLDSLLSSLVAQRNWEMDNGTPEGVDAINDAIAALKRHPYFQPRIDAALREMAEVGQDMEPKEH